MSAASLSRNWPAIREMLVRRRWWFLLPLLAGWLAVMSLHWVLPPDYQSQALLLIEHQTVPQSYVQSNVTFNPGQLLQSMGLQVLSRDRLAALVREHNLYPALAQQQGLDAAIAKLQKEITIQPASLAALPHPPAGEWSAISIGFTAHSPSLAQAVDNDLTTSFIQQNLRATQQASSSTTAFLGQQVQQEAATWRTAQAHVESFERGHLGLLPGQDQANLAVVMSTESSLAAAQAARDRTQQDIVAARALLQQAPTTAQTSLQQQLQILQAQLSDLRSRYTSKYPAVEQAETQIAALQAQLHSSHAVPGGPQSPARQQAQSQLQADESVLPQQQAQVKQLQQKLNRYQNRLTLAPLPAAQLAALEGQAQQAQDAYERLLAKLNASSMASQLEMQQGGAQFRLVNAPNLPRQPVWPKPASLCVLGLLAGLCLGGCVGAAAEVLQDRVRGEADLVALGLCPVLARIPPLFSAQQAARRRVQHGIEWAAASGVVLLIAAGTLWMLRLGGGGL
ncbi:MAG: hypothetical protein ACRD1Y_11515 [Terriglobales bacterium]